MIFLVLPDIVYFLHLARQDLRHKQHDEQEPVDIHEKQSKQERVEEEVERDVGNRLDAGDAGGPHNFKGEPVQTEPKPCDAKANGTHVGQDVIDEVLFPSPDLEINVDLGEFQLNVIDVVKKEDENANVVVSKGIGECDQGQSDEVMHHHDKGVLPPCVHVDRGIYRMAVEAALDKVSYRNIGGY